MSTSATCVDASFVLRMFLGPDDAEAWSLWEGWQVEGRSVHAPQLLAYEVTNVIYRYRRAGYLSLATAALAVDAALGLPIVRESPADLHGAALRLAADLGLPAASDAHYLALAKLLDAELWTADARLARDAGDLGPTIRVVGSSNSDTPLPHGR
jgi:predicted nucleic acid-binding protein